MIVVVVASFVLLGFRPAGGVAGAAAAVVLAVFFGWCMDWVFVALTTMVRKVQALQAVAFIVTFPLMFASSAYMPIAAMPWWMRVLSTVNPVTYAVDATRGLSAGVASVSAFSPQREPPLPWRSSAVSPPREPSGGNSSSGDSRLAGRRPCAVSRFHDGVHDLSIYKGLKWVDETVVDRFLPRLGRAGSPHVPWRQVVDDDDSAGSHEPAVLRISAVAISYSCPPSTKARSNVPALLSA